MDLFPLAIFPEGSLSSSVIPAVWVGISVVCFFNLRLGWVSSGLVVSGYLVPLMLIKPWAAGVVLFESILTYFLIWFLSEYLSRWAHWCNFFGRDRFFALVLCSIVVRMVFDGWLLPELGAWANAYWHIAFDYRNNLHSFGLIIVSLIANQFWKTGFVRGFIPLFVTLALTLIIVRYGLMELTNYTLSSVSYLYEEMATSILSTPKAYIILVSTAFLASRMNLYYGWDFNGILIPSLLALQWYQPIKILATIMESTIILWLAILILKTPLFRKTTIEGTRKLLLFFNISFAYKIGLGYAILTWFPALKVTDYFGFGYLLSTLMALKIHDKAIFARLTRATLQTSLVAVIVANFIGFTLMQLPINELFIHSKVVDNPPTSINPINDTPQNLTTLLQQKQIELYQTKLTRKFIPPLPAEIELFTQALNELQAYLKQPDDLKLQDAATILGKINYRLERVNKGRYLVLHEQASLRGWGTYIFDTAAQSELALEIPAPLEGAGIFDAGVGLFNGFEARSLAISDSGHKAAADGLNNPQSFFQVFHHLINRHNSVQLRIYNAKMARQFAGIRHTSESIELTGLSSGLWIKERLPEGLDLAKLKQVLNHFNIHWATPPFYNQQREHSRYGFAELILTPQDVRQLLLSPLLLAQQASLQHIEQALSIEGYLQEWILNRKQTIAPKGSQLYQRPKPEELLFLDEQVLTPLLSFIRRIQLEPANNSEDYNELQTIAQASSIMGYSLIKYHDRLSQQDYLVLAEQDNKPAKYWGIYIFRLGVNNHPYGVQIPRPLYEINSLEYGVALFEHLKARILMIGATHPNANLDGSADLITPNNKLSVFNLVNQVVLREAHDTELMQTSVRAFSYRRNKSFPDADIIFSLAEGVVPRELLTPLSKNLLFILESDNMKVQLADGSEQTTGYEVGSTAQAFYLEATAHKNFAILWLSPTARAAYRQQNENLLQAAQFNSLNIPTLEQDLVSYLQQQQGFSSNTVLDNNFRELLTQYTLDQDVTRLQQVVSRANEQSYSLIRLIDRNSKQAIVVCKDAAGVPFALSLLSARTQEASYIDEKLPLPNQVIDFINQRKTWLLKRSN
ncbi:hypothetical protein BCS42_05270 [Crenothrix sp. D3]|nr:hypothetical protein BCS42_05270 [Crenothrix sp. D3]